MIDLRLASGLQISLSRDRLISLGINTIIPEPRARTLEEMRPYFYDSNVSPARNEIYLIYRDICPKQDNRLFKENNLRYDITVIFSDPLGLELPKTYEILHGNACFLLQAREEGEPEVYLIQAGPGDKVIVPPGFGHVSVL